jgi:hypothetical protein
VLITALLEQIMGGDHDSAHASAAALAVTAGELSSTLGLPASPTITA